MAYKAPLHLKKLGLTAEEELFKKIEESLDNCGSNIFLERGSSNPKENGEFGDCLCKPSEDEMELVSLELKGSTYPMSFSLSDYEKRCSLAKWVIVKGTRGIWCVTMEIARQYLTQQGTEGDKYWSCQPPFSAHVAFSDVIDDIRRVFNEID